MILDTVELIDHSQAVALTYVEAYTLRRSQLDEVLGKYPQAEEHITKARRKITMQRALLKWMCREILGKKAPSSFVPRSVARGFKHVPDATTMEQKVNAMFSHFKERDKERAAPPPSAAPMGGAKLAPLVGHPSSVPSTSPELAAMRRDVAELKEMMQQLLRQHSQRGNGGQQSGGGGAIVSG